MSFREGFFQRIPKDFHDPVTGLIPKCETEMSALLVHFHAVGMVAWDKVRLYPVVKGSGEVFASKYIQSHLQFYCEYPLFFDSSTVDIWGQMCADLLQVSTEKQNVVLIENKIGSGFTSKGTQLDRQAAYLSSSKFKKKVLIVLSLKYYFDRGWYVEELRNAQEKNAGVSIYYLHWEDVFLAMRF